MRKNVFILCLVMRGDQPAAVRTNARTPNHVRCTGDRDFGGLV